MEKKCFKCGAVKNIDNFYKHPRMGDGHLNKCIECTKKDSIKTYNNIKNNPEKAFKERIRQAIKEKKRRKEGRAIKGERSVVVDCYKKKAVTSAQHIKAPEGMHKHHWSYNEKHFKDVVIIPYELHVKIHRYMIYDKERLMYRRLDGVLLDSKESAVAYYDYVSTLMEGEFPYNPPAVPF